MRKQLLASASVQQHGEAIRLLDEAYSDFKKSCSEKHKKYLPEAAPAKFAAEKYYAFLKEQVLGRLHVHVASEAL